MVELINSFPDFSGSFGDKRIEQRAARALQKLTLGRSSSLRQITQNEAEQKSFYRLFNNESFSEQAIEQSIVKRCGQLCKGRHLLCIQDTTEFNLSGQQGRVKAASGLGQDDQRGYTGIYVAQQFSDRCKCGQCFRILLYQSMGKKRRYSRPAYP